MSSFKLRITAKRSTIKANNSLSDLENNMKKFLKVLAIFGKVVGCILLLLAFIYLPDWGFLKGEFTEYPVMCKVNVVLGHCSKISYTPDTTTYKVSTDRQEVVFWNGGGGYVSRATKCA